jgi:hypothetical protein
MSLGSLDQIVLSSFSDASGTRFLKYLRYCEGLRSAIGMASVVGEGTVLRMEIAVLAVRYAVWCTGPAVVGR